MTALVWQCCTDLQINLYQGLSLVHNWFNSRSRKYTKEKNERRKGKREQDDDDEDVEEEEEQVEWE